MLKMLKGHLPRVIYHRVYLVYEDNCAEFSRPQESRRRCLPSQWTSRVSLPQTSGGYVTTFALHKAQKAIVSGKLTFDERMVLHREVLEELLLHARDCEAHNLEKRETSLKNRNQMFSFSGVMSLTGAHDLPPPSQPRVAPIF